MDNTKEKEINIIDNLFWKIAIKDDETAFRTLFFQFFSPLCVFAHRYIDNWETCEDIVQDTFFKIWKNRKNIERQTITSKDKTNNRKHAPRTFYCHE